MTDPSLSDNPSFSIVSPVNSNPVLMIRGIKEAARVLGLGERTVWSLVNRNAIPHHQCGRAKLFVPAELSAWIDAGCPADAGAAISIRAKMKSGRTQ